MTKHTPGKLSTEAYKRGSIEIVDERGQRVADVNGGNKEVVAARIVHTWNCHDELVEALEKARVELEELTVEFMGENYNNPELNAALKLAKGE